MSYEFYKVLHLAGIVSLFLALGGLIGFETKAPRWTSSLHGTALGVIALGGFGLAARLGIVGAKAAGPIPPWLIGKMAVWLILGGILVLAKRRLMPRAVLALSVILLGTLSAALAVIKPGPQPPLVDPQPTVSRT